MKYFLFFRIISTVRCNVVASREDSKQVSGSLAPAGQFTVEVQTHSTTVFPSCLGCNRKRKVSPSLQGHRTYEIFFEELRDLVGLPDEQRGFVQVRLGPAVWGGDSGGGGCRGQLDGRQEARGAGSRPAPPEPQLLKPLYVLLDLLLLLLQLLHDL